MLSLLLTLSIAVALGQQPEIVWGRLWAIDVGHHELIVRQYRPERKILRVKCDDDWLRSCSQVLDLARQCDLIAQVPDFPVVV